MRSAEDGEVGEEEQSVFFLACTEKRNQKEEACPTPSWKQAFILPDKLEGGGFYFLQSSMAKAKKEWLCIGS